ncbi:unnamed protein product [Ectocarpus fasciculatus]
MDAFANVPNHQKQEFMEHLEAEQMRESLRMYNTLVESCFDRCIMNFQSKSMDDTEKKCVNMCAQKYLKTTQRAGFRFAEQQAAKAQQAQAPNP